MPTNTDITIFRKELNTKTNLYEYKRIYYEFVNWQGGLDASLNKGYEQANDVNIYIPKIANNIENVNIYEFKIGDIICKGNIKEVITKESDLKKYTQVYNIKTIVPRDLGSDAIQHIEIGAK